MKLPDAKRHRRRGGPAQRAIASRLDTRVLRRMSSRAVIEWGGVHRFICGHTRRVHMYVHALSDVRVCIMALGAGQDLGQQVALHDLADVSHKWKLVAEKLNLPYSKARSGAVSACAARLLYHTSEWLWHDVGQCAGVYVHIHHTESLRYSCS